MMNFGKQADPKWDYSNPRQYSTATMDRFGVPGTGGDHGARHRKRGRMRNVVSLMLTSTPSPDVDSPLKGDKCADDSSLALGTLKIKRRSSSFSGPSSVAKAESPLPCAVDSQEASYSSSSRPSSLLLPGEKAILPTLRFDALHNSGNYREGSRESTPKASGDVGTLSPAAVPSPCVDGVLQSPKNRNKHTILQPLGMSKPRRKSKEDLSLISAPAKRRSRSKTCADQPESPSSPPQRRKRKLSVTGMSMIRALKEKSELYKTPRDQVHHPDSGTESNSSSKTPRNMSLNDTSSPHAYRDDRVGSPFQRAASPSFTCPLEQDVPQYTSPRAVRIRSPEKELPKGAPPLPPPYKNSPYHDELDVGQSPKLEPLPSPPIVSSSISVSPRHAIITPPLSPSFEEEGIWCAHMSPTFREEHEWRDKSPHIRNGKDTLRRSHSSSRGGGRSGSKDGGKSSGESKSGSWINAGSRSGSWIKGGSMRGRKGSEQEPSQPLQCGRVPSCGSRSRGNSPMPISTVSKRDTLSNPNVADGKDTMVTAQLSGSRTPPLEPWSLERTPERVVSPLPRDNRSFLGDFSPKTFFGNLSSGQKNKAAPMTLPLSRFRSKTPEVQSSDNIRDTLCPGKMPRSHHSDPDAISPPTSPESRSLVRANSKDRSPVGGTLPRGRRPTTPSTDLYKPSLTSSVGALRTGKGTTGLSGDIQSEEPRNRVEGSPVAQIVDGNRAAAAGGEQGGRKQTPSGNSLRVRNITGDGQLSERMGL